MNVIKNIGSKGEKLSFSISRSYYVKPCSFVLSPGDVGCSVSWLLCQNVKDTVELHDRYELIVIITEHLPYTR